MQMEKVALKSKFIVCPSCRVTTIRATIMQASVNAPAPITERDSEAALNPALAEVR